MRRVFMEVTLHDEAPKIGCGRRIVAVTKGRKWVHLVAPMTGAKAKIPRDKFDALNPLPVKVRRQYRKPPKRRPDDAPHL